MSEIYVSVDIEADGPIPGEFSMLSLGAAAFTPEGELKSKFLINLETLPTARQDPDTMDWWSSQPKAWEACRKDPAAPADAMRLFHGWVTELPGKPVFVGYPATYDFLFVYWYLMRFVGKSPFSFSGLDIKTMAMTMMGTDYRKATKRHMPTRWFEGVRPHTHNALDDAIGQGILFCNMLREARR